MKLAVVGLGQAGGKILDRLLEWDEQTGSDIVRAGVAVNSAKADLMGLKRVHPDNRILIGQSRVKGHGVGADNELGAEVAAEDIDEIQGALDSVPVHEVDAFLVIAGLGGGTGSGAAPVVASHLKRLYTEPVYALGVLPGQDEGGIYTLNAARSLLTIVKEVDNLILFDNDAWRATGESVEGGYDRANDELVRRLGLLFGAGEFRNGDVVAESVVDASEIINTLAGGGISTIGYAADPIEVRKSAFGKRKLVIDDDVDATNRITSLIRKATLGRLTLPCEVSAAERALVVTAGPPQLLDRKGIERGRAWLEEQTGSMEVRGGDYPITDTRSVAAIVLLAGVTKIPRVKELQQVAIEAQQNMRDIRAERAGKFDQLVHGNAEAIKPLF